SKNPSASAVVLPVGRSGWTGGILTHIVLVHGEGLCRIKLRTTEKKKGDKNEATGFAELQPPLPTPQRSCEPSVVGIEPTTSWHYQALFPCSRHRHSPKDEREATRVKRH